MIDYQFFHDRFLWYYAVIVTHISPIGNNGCQCLFHFYLLKNGLDETTKSCSLLEQEIKQTLQAKKELGASIVNTKWHGIAQNKHFEKYQAKVQRYRHSVDEYIKESEYSKIVRAKESAVDLLREKCKHLIL